MDRSKIEEFLERFVDLASGATTIGLLAVADRSGLLGFLGQGNTGNTDQIADQAGLDARYVREILSGLAAAGVVDYDPGSGVFTLPPEHALLLSDTDSPYFMGGWLDMVPAVMTQIDGIVAATKNGGGVRFESFGPDLIRGLDRGNAPSQRALLIKRWLPAVPGLVGRLESGIRVADIGCGSGTAAIVIARAFPNSNVVGFDIADSSLQLARERSGDLDNVEFRSATVEEIPVEPGFDLVTSFDVIHDLSDPMAGLRRIRQSLSQNGLYLMMEPEADSDLEGNLNPRGAMLYGISALHCMTQSLARGGEGLGAAWGRQRAESYAREAGFSGFRVLEEISNRFSAFYLLTM